MKKRVFFGMNTLGWLMIFVVLLMLAVYGVASDDDLYFQLQMEVRILDKRLADGLFVPVNADASFDNREIEVFGKQQPPFNERELEHLYDCRRLISSIQPGVLYVLLLATGALLLFCGGRGRRSGRLHAAWLALALLLLPLMAFGVWAAIDFDAAFTFFHYLLFTNDLWLLDPATDLLIRICPQSMFAEMGLRIARRAAFMLLGVPLVLTVREWFSKRQFKWISDMRKRRKQA